MSNWSRQVLGSEQLDVSARWERNQGLCIRRNPEVSIRVVLRSVSATSRWSLK
jgi:hypothetical protein